VVLVTELMGPRDASESLTVLASVRQRVHVARSEVWFPLLVFGVITLLSAPLYWRYGLREASCSYNVTAKCASSVSKSSPSGFLTPVSGLNGLSPWLSAYWVLAFAIGFGTSIWHFQVSTNKIGARGRFRLAVVIGVLLIAAVALTNLFAASLSQSLIINDVWIRGTASLVILALFFVIVSVVEHSFSFLIYSLILLGLTLLSSLYDVSNLFSRVGIDAPFASGGEELPGILSCAIYLILGGIGYWLLQRNQQSVGEVSVRSVSQR
jgi:hypothetical protein